MTDEAENVKMNPDVKRLLIYLVLSFTLTFLWFFAVIPKGQTWDDMTPEMQSFVALGMLFPFISHILTRWITHEGFAMTGDGSMRMGISFKDRKWVFFVLALILPWIYMESANIISLIIAPQCFDPEHYVSLDIDKRLIMILPLNAMVSGTLVSVAALGEEGGWRGYMMPKLINIMGRGKALVIGGIIWGLWHAPLTCIGHNFGTDYPGFPYVGIIKMCIFCTLMGIILTFLTEKSGSVWPAVFMHAVNNNSPSILNGYIDHEKAANAIVSPYWIGMLVSLVTIALILWKCDRGTFPLSHGTSPHKA